MSIPLSRKPNYKVDEDNVNNRSSSLAVSESRLLSENEVNEIGKLFTFAGSELRGAVTRSTTYRKS
jgi:hypothetical protein